MNNRGLILFFDHSLWIQTCLVFVLACSGQKDGATNLEIIWEDERARGLIIPSVYLSEVPPDSIHNFLRIYLSSSDNRTPILGDYQQAEDGIVFKPLIPFTSGLTYEVSVAGKAIGRIEVPVPVYSDLPALKAIYPSQDTLPENLLKFYFEFSHPMREGQALKHITLIKNGTDTLLGTFLDLQPELWNRDYTLLTLWLDPGRIKRDLQPNQTLGVPLEHATSYTLVVRPGWADTRGAMITENISKNFFVTERDSIRPDLKRWLLKVPEPHTTDPLVIAFTESLDRVLSGEALRIISANGNTINGRIVLKNEEAVLEFTPESPWGSGTYLIECEERLEDLAGNNLNRQFDRDLTKDAEQSTKDVFVRKFDIL
ncbi:MAG TPA: Ig-like domain-containing protein [Chryseolinea sp.]